MGSHSGSSQPVLTPAVQEPTAAASETLNSSLDNVSASGTITTHSEPSVIENNQPTNGDIVTEERVIQAEENSEDYVTCRTDKTLQAEDFQTADDDYFDSDRVTTPTQQEQHTVAPVPIPAEYSLPPP